MAAGKSLTDIYFSMGYFPSLCGFDSLFIIKCLHILPMQAIY